MIILERDSEIVLDDSKVLNEVDKYESSLLEIFKELDLKL